MPPNPQNLKPFVKGDPRINRKGRPIRDAAKLRKAWQDIWAEVLYDDKGNPIIDESTGKELTRLAARMRIATSSRNPAELRVALEYAFGKVRDEVDITSGGKPLKAYVNISPSDWKKINDGES